MQEFNFGNIPARPRKTRKQELVEQLREIQEMQDTLKRGPMGEYVSNHVDPNGTLSNETLEFLKGLSR